MAMIGDRNPLVKHNEEYCWISYHADLAQITRDWASALILQALIRMSEYALSKACERGHQWKRGDPIPISVSIETIMHWTQDLVSKNVVCSATSRLHDAGLIYKFQSNNGKRTIYLVNFDEINRRLSDLPSPPRPDGRVYFVPPAMIHEEIESTKPQIHNQSMGNVQLETSTSIPKMGSCITQAPGMSTFPNLGWLHPKNGMERDAASLFSVKEEREENGSLPPYIPPEGQTVDIRGGNSVPEDHAQRNTINCKDSGEKGEHPLLVEKKQAGSEQNRKPEGTGRPEPFLSSLPTPPNSAAPPSPLDTSTDSHMQISEYDEWDMKAAGSRWKSIVPGAKWNAEIRRYVEERSEQLQQIPFSALVAAMEAFSANDAMREAGYPYRAFWSKPESWMPRERAELAYNAPKPSAPTATTTKASEAPYKPKERDFVAIWNEHCPSSPTDQTLYRAFGWREAVADERFCENFEDLAKTVERLRKSSDYGWMTLPWLLNQKPGNAKRNWERVLDGEFRPRGVMLDMRKVDEIAKQRAQREESIKELIARQKREAEEKRRREEEERERRYHQEWLKKEEAKMAQMTPEEREAYLEERRKFRERMMNAQALMNEMRNKAKRIAV